MPRIKKLYRAFDGLFSHHIAKDAVIRADESPVRQLQGDRSPRTPHSGIDYDEMDGIGSEVLIRRVKNVRCLLKVLRGNLMRDVHEADAGGDGEHHAFHGPHVAVSKAEVRGEGDDG